MQILLTKSITQRFLFYFLPAIGGNVGGEGDAVGGNVEGGGAIVGLPVGLSGLISPPGPLGPNITSIHNLIDGGIIGGFTHPSPGFGDDPPVIGGDPPAGVVATSLAAMSPPIKESTFKIEKLLKFLCPKFIAIPDNV